MKISELEAALEEAKASVLYVKAEGENIRRRAMDDIDKARKFALEKFSNELLAVKDSLDAALLIEATDVQSYKDGVELTAKQLVSVFDKFNIAEINPLGEKFDPNKHQAISMLENSGEPNTVINVLQKGYTLNERVLRPALVMVAK
jgi:molecular chaperone GrpE